MKERILHAGHVPFNDFWALRDVEFEVHTGETFGIIGRNGSGKSTLLKCIAGILQPTTGQIVVRGQVAAMLELGAGFQPELSGRDNIFLNASLLGLSRREIERRFDAIVAFAELEDFIDNQVRFYSSGMYVRLGFAVAVNVEPDVLLDRRGARRRRREVPAKVHGTRPPVPERGPDDRARVALRGRRAPGLRPRRGARDGQGRDRCSPGSKRSGPSATACSPGKCPSCCRRRSPTRPEPSKSSNRRGAS